MFDRTVIDGGYILENVNLCGLFAFFSREVGLSLLHRGSDLELVFPPAGRTLASQEDSLSIWFMTKAGSASFFIQRTLDSCEFKSTPHSLTHGLNHPPVSGTRVMEKERKLTPDTYKDVSNMCGMCAFCCSTLDAVP